MTLNGYNVKINPMDTSSTTLTQKEEYTFSLLDHIQRILKNLFLFSKMYFGPGVEASEVVELWQEQIWNHQFLVKHHYGLTMVRFYYLLMILLNNIYNI